MWKNLTSITSKLFHLNLRETVTIPIREKGEITQRRLQDRLPVNKTRYRLPKPKKKLPVWLLRPERSSNEAFITPGNKEFIAEVLGDQYDASGLIKAVPSNTKCDDANQLIDIKDKVVESEFKPSVRRCGVIARKIGFLRMWRNDGKRITATGLQIDDNHVISYHDPGEYDPVRMPNVKNFKKMGTVLVGAGSVNPYLLTKEYCGLFKDSGVMPKKILSRFFVSPAAKLPPATPLLASHFRVGDFVDVRGVTVNRGFQGVMKRWGFKGMPATHGVTKTHRRGGNIGSGGEKARVWPGTKMPGGMGNRTRTIRGMQIVRINYANNVIFVNGPTMGEHNSVIKIFDTMLKTKRETMKPPVPTSFTKVEDVDDVYAEGFHNLENPTIKYEVD